eukprot:CAMPEP_0177625246 /NCGR_PEP_ID=MMETSP0419_2-20121207/29982_1 /TAXON_ID=582737 /ORGANISM="Tetraselmis sp., Strain GSL018" /LENGTH=182 /DNA_ID=CAMNT_0019126149 /DNA_START=588 /DNA_END=1132 /DNA_ORIENTATION=-
MGDQVYQALCKLAIISRHERFAQFLKPLYFVTRLYVASLGYLVQEVLSDVSDLKRNHNLKFWLGADEAISEGRDLLSALGPCSEAALELAQKASGRRYTDRVEPRRSDNPCCVQGYLVQEVLSDVSDLKRNHNLKFWLGADEAISEGRDLLSALGPCSEAAWSLHKRLLEDVTQIALNPDEA